MARSRIPSRVVGLGASSSACTSFFTRYGTKRELVLLKGMARMRRICSSAAGWRCSKKRKNERIAANRIFRVSAEFCREVSQMLQERADQRRIQLLQLQH